MPTVVIQPGLDTYIQSNSPAINYGLDQNLFIGNVDAVLPLKDQWKGLLKFDLSGIPSNAYVFTATLYLYDAGTDTSDLVPISTYRVLKNWIDVQATWNESATGIPWATAGCASLGTDYNSTVLDTTIIGTTTTQWYDWNVSTQVRNWVWGNHANYGVLIGNLSPDIFSNNKKEFWSSEYVPNPLLRPKLEIIYELAPDIPTLASEPIYTKGISNTITWSDESASGAIEYFPQAATNSSFIAGILSFVGQNKVEYIQPLVYDSVSTYYSISEIEGIYLNENKTGTNYHAGGSFNRNVITLGTTLSTVTTPSFTGSGLNDMSAGGVYVGGGTKRVYVIQIDGIGIPDTFRWSDDGGSTWSGSVAITGAAQALSNGVTITFVATTGHTLGATWTFVAKVPTVYVFYKSNGWIPDKTTATFENLTDGQKYYYHVKARNVLDAETNWSNTTYSTQDDIIDTLQLLSPNGAEVWDGGFTKVIQWKAIDNTSGLTANATLSISGDAGVTWDIIDTALNVNYLYDEEHTSITERRVYTDYYIKNVIGVWAATDLYTIGSLAFTGTGLNDLSLSGTYTGIHTKYYRVVIDSTGLIDTFSWSDDGGVNWNATSVPITGAAQLLNDGVTITFAAITGHTLANRWDFVGGHNGTNYYSTNGMFDGREIYLDIPLPDNETQVVIDYITYGKYFWTIPINIDSATSRVKVEATDNVGNTLIDVSDKDFTIITIKNRLHDSVFNTSTGTYIDKLMRTYAYNEQVYSHATDNVKRGYFITKAEDTDLDVIAPAYNVSREPDESDKSFRSRILNSLTALKNTKQAILDAVAPYVNDAWIYEWAGDWEHDRCFFLDWSFLDWRDYISGGILRGLDGAPFTFEVHIRPKSEPRLEKQTSSSRNSVFTDFPILYLSGVYDNLDKQGTNYFRPVPPGNFTVGPAVFTGTGINDMITGGFYMGATLKNYRIQIDSVGPVDSFRWSIDNGVTWEQTFVPITGSEQKLINVTPTKIVNDQVLIKFAAVTGHTIFDRWDFVISNKIVALGTTLPTHPMTVYIDYTPQLILRKIALAVDFAKPAGTLAYIILELGSYYGENYYAEFYFGG